MRFAVKLARIDAATSAMNKVWRDKEDRVTKIVIDPGWNAMQLKPGPAHLGWPIPHVQTMLQPSANSAQVELSIHLESI
jgi:hypothetical protein